MRQAGHCEKDQGRVSVRGGGEEGTRNGCRERSCVVALRERSGGFLEGAGWKRPGAAQWRVHCLEAGATGRTGLRSSATPERSAHLGSRNQPGRGANSNLTSNWLGFLFSG